MKTWWSKKRQERGERVIQYNIFSASRQVTAETQEKEKLITHLQEKVTSLEKRLEQNLSGEEHVQELLKEVMCVLLMPLPSDRQW
jgi:golgin subfamily A protein 1